MPSVYSLGDVRDKEAPWLLIPKPITLERLEYHAVFNAIAYYDGRQDHAAAALGISTNTLSKKMKRYGIQTGAHDPSKGEP